MPKLQARKMHKAGSQLKTPVLLIVFNRPNNTQEVLNEIRKVKPKRLYVTADGPRNEKDKDNVEAVRRIVLSGIDWDCEVKTNFSEENLGCRRAVSEGITWFFKNEEMGIILEDDCLPDPTFFAFCEDLLLRFCDTREVGMISSGLIDTEFESSYSFINYPLIWGWASWKRVWENYNVDASFIESASEVEHLPGLRHSLAGVKRFWATIYKNIDTVNTWDYQLTLLFLKHNLKTVYPNKTLVRNTGLSGESTHTFEDNSIFSLESQSINFPLKHPNEIVANLTIQSLIERAIFYEKPIWERAFSFLLKRLNLR